ncbi:MAG: putative FtsK/SpoIIIE family protein [Frankiales bacterium]|nr:putative FtsK/SpoIIIE family protein [Frankiales bacterium]
MQIVFRSSAGEQELDVELRNPEGTVADLVRGVLGTSAPDQVTVAGRPVPATTLLSDSGLHEAATVEVVPPLPPVPEVRTTGLELVVVAGPRCGAVLPVPLGRSTLGRGTEARLVVPSRTVSRRHALLDADLDGVLVTDDGSANGTLVDGVLLDRGGSARLLPDQLLQVGSVGLRLRAARTDDRPNGLDPRRHAGPAGTVPFNRPPRPARPPEPAELAVPEKPSPPSATPFGIATFVGGFAMAGLMVAITGQLRYAAFSAVMPFLAVGTWYEAKRREKTGAGRGRRTYLAALEGLRQGIAREAVVERRRLQEVAPDVGEVLRRALQPSTRLWERRPDADDALQVSAGIADLPWRPPLDSTWAGLDDDVLAVMEEVRVPTGPVVVDLSHGGVVGVVGERTAALAVARSLLLQAAVHQGPADLTVGVFVDPGREREWEWAKWLPHTRVPGSPASRWLAHAREQSDALLRRLLGGAGRGTVLVVLDSAVLTEGRDAPARDLLQAGRRSRDDARPGGFALLGARPDEQALRTAGIVLAPTADRLPAACTTVVSVHDEDGTAVVTRVEQGETVRDVLTAGVDVDTARDCARALAQYEDPELHVVGGGLPQGVRLLPLLELDRVDGPNVLARWRRSGRDPGALAPLGVTEQGRFLLDLVRDGAHGLVGGTTGSGKSELLRSLVAALAAHTDPHHLTFVLVDYKGGAAFDVCSRLPHTVGLVTDLDEQLGERALLALEAELHHRERQLRQVGADNLPEYLALTADDPAAEPMPRLVVVIDEFATMAAELPDFVSSLVGIAQRGRTLGVHLILATQRPSGAVNDNIKANTNLRIALRVQDSADSSDVIGVGDAASIGRTQPGRAFVRLGPGEVVPIQTALVTCVTDEASDLAVDASPFLFGPTSRAPDLDTGAAPDDVRRPTDLARLVDAVVEANALAGLAPPRRPWPEALGPEVDLASVADAPQPGPAPVAFVALADDPRRQTQYPLGWDLAEGNLLLYGVPGSGTTTTLASLCLSLCGALSPEQLEVQVLDAGPGDLQPLEELPHVGTVVLAGDRERQARLLRHLRAELDRRRALPREQALARRTVVLIDGFPALRAEFDDLDGQTLIDGLARVFADGPELGLSFAMTSDRASGFPPAFSAVATQKWLFRLSDAYDYSTAGLSRKHVPQPVPGRMVVSPSALQAQVGRPLPDLVGAVAKTVERWPGASTTATVVGVLPSDVALAELPPPDLSGEPWRIPVGVRESDLQPGVLALYEGEHVLVAGPARSGRSTALWTFATALAPAGCHVVATGGRRSPLRDCPALDEWLEPAELSAGLAALRSRTGPCVLLVDDAEGFDDGDGALAGLLGAGLPDLHVVAAGRPDAVRTLYGHWTSTVRKSKTGLLLRPDVDMDGDLVGAVLPRRAPVRLGTGRGYLVHDGGLDLLQVARP